MAGEREVSWSICEPGLCRTGRRAAASEAKRREATPEAGQFSYEVTPGSQRSPRMPIWQ